MAIPFGFVTLSLLMATGSPGSTQEMVGRISSRNRFDSRPIAVSTAKLTQPADIPPFIADPPWWFFFAALAGTNSGLLPQELVGLIDADDYFRSRQVAVNVAKMIELTGAQPSDGKAEIQQLLAIRWLGDHPDDVKKEPKARTTLEKVAQGAAGQDALGFAKEHAQAALARLDGKPIPRRILPPDSLCRDGLAWFPASQTVISGIDLRAVPDAPAADEKLVRDCMNRLWSAHDKDRFYQPFYQFAEDLGNVRLDRVTFAFRVDSNDQNKGRLYARFTGLASPRKLAELIAKSRGEGAVAAEKGPNGEPLLLIASTQSAAFAVVGNHDVLMANYEGSPGNNLELIREALDVLAGKKPHLLAGPNVPQFQSVASTAACFVSGRIAERARQELENDQSAPLKPLPDSATLYVVKGKKITIHGEGTFANKDDAAAFTASVNRLREGGLKQLDKLGADQLKPESLKLLRTALGTLRADAKETSVVVTMEIPSEIANVYWELAEKYLLR